MTPDSEQTVLNVLKNSGMFTDGQIGMATVVLDPVISAIEDERDENLKMLQGFRRRAHEAEDALQALKEQKDGERTEPELKEGELSPFNDTPYMTIIPGRSPKKKVHPSLGQAHAAISYRLYGSAPSYLDMELYEFKGSRWVLLESIPKGTLKQDLSWRKGKK